MDRQKSEQTEWRCISIYVKGGMAGWMGGRKVDGGPMNEQIEAWMDGQMEDQ